MAWVNPSTVATGDVLTASKWNQDVAENTQVLYNSMGLWEVASGSFSAAANVDVTGVFSASYTNYRAILHHKASANDVAVSIRMMVGATPDATANAYTAAFSGVSSGGTAQAIITTDSSWASITLSDDDGTARSCTIIDFLCPFSTARDTTVFVSTYSGARAQRSGGGSFVGTTSFDGFRVFPTSGTLTGVYVVYGYGV